MRVVLTPLGNVYPLRPLQKLSTMELAKCQFFPENKYLFWVNWYWVCKIIVLYTYLFPDQNDFSRGAGNSSFALLPEANGRGQ